jgi:HTH-type transcriptional regulator/antitoxin HigA
MTGHEMAKNAIHPIKSEADHDAAIERITELVGSKLGSAEADELDVLVTLVDAYESEHCKMDAPDPISAIQFRMEQQGLTRNDLIPLIGSRARVSEVLTGKRNLTIPMIRRMRSSLGISADVLIAPQISRRSGLRTARVAAKSR